MKDLIWEQYENKDGDIRFCNLGKTGLVSAVTGDLRCPTCKRVYDHEIPRKKNVCIDCKGDLKLQPLTLTEHKWIWPKLRAPLKSDLQEILQDVSSIVDDMLVLPSESDRIIFILWAINTWIYDRFNTFPHLQFIAPVRSGKSKALDVLQRTAYHPILSMHFTPAAMCRAIESYHTTLLVDQAENAFDYRTEIGRNRYDIFCAGYRKGEHYVTASTEDDHSLVIKDVYSPKALASQRSFDNTIDSRSIKINIREAKPPVFEFTEAEEEFCSQIRQKLLWFHFCDHDLRTPGQFLSGRLREKYQPLLSLAQHASMKTDLIMQKAASDEEAFIEDLKMSREARLISTIIEELNGIEERESIKLTDLSVSSGINSRVIGKMLKNLGFATRHFRDGSYIMLDGETRKSIDYYAKKFEVA